MPATACFDSFDMQSAAKILNMPNATAAGDAVPLSQLQAAIAGQAAKNFLVNSNFSITQLQARATLTGYATAGYSGLDQWYLYHDAGTTAVQCRVWKVGDSSPPIAFNTLAADTYAEFKNNSASAAGILICQPIEAVEAMNILSGSGGIFANAQAAASSNSTIRMALFEWSGAPDSASEKQIVTGFSSHVPTFATTTLTKLATATISSGVTASWQALSLPTAPSSGNATGYVLAIWVESLPAAASLYVANADLYIGTIARPFTTLGPNVEFQRCQRFLQTFPPGSALTWTTLSSFLLRDTPLPVVMRVAPTFSTTVTGWNATFGSQGATEMSGQAYTTVTSVTIVGSLTISAPTSNPQQVVLQLAAGTSWSSGAGTQVRTQQGTGAFLILSAQL